MNNPKISVIMPVYNTEKYLKKSISNILKQTYSDFELLLIDDGSTDSSYNICEEFAKQDNRIKVIHKANEGQGVARNLGLSIAQGSFISFVDSDDYVDEDFLETLLYEIESNSADISITNLKAFDGRFTFDAYSTLKTLYNNSELMEAYLKNEFQPGVVDKLFKKELFDYIRFPEIRAREDYYIMHLILSQVNVAVHTGTTKYLVNIRRNSTEHKKFSDEKLSIIECSNRLREFIQKNYPNLYRYVLLKPDVSRLQILEDIIRSKNYQQNMELYLCLSQEIISDYQIQKKHPEFLYALYKDVVESFINSPEQYRKKIRIKAKKEKLQRIKAIIRSKLII